ncbi:MAG: SDR family oxidoreductase [Leptospirales bacterium]|nr:SDR family oxidoreductase [Leptospirales bacterium]
MNSEGGYVVSGASRGIGREIVRQLTRSGARVFGGVRDPAAAAAADLDEFSERIEYLPLDVSDGDSARRFASILQHRNTKLLGLVNNAGILPEQSPGQGVEDEIEAMREALETNTFGALRLTRLLAPMMSAGGCVVNVSSGMGQLADMNSGYSAYRVSKTALNAITKILAEEYGARGIKVNSVCPGWVRTDMGGASAPRSVEQGADTIVWLLQQGARAPGGKFLRDRQEIPW